MDSYFLLSEHSHEPLGDEHVYEHTYDVVGDGYERAGGEGRVDFETLEGERHEGAENRREQHNSHQRQRYCQGGGVPWVELECIVDEHQQRDGQAIDEANSHLFEYLFP